MAYLHYLSHFIIFYHYFSRSDMTRINQTEEHLFLIEIIPLMKRKKKLGY